MYAVIRSGGKQYRVSPGEVVKVEKLPPDQGPVIEFKDVLAVSSQEGQIQLGKGAVVSGQILDSGRGDKVLVFHFKRKKQYKKIFGHRQPFTAVHITEIAFDGQRYTAPELPVPKPKAEPKAEGSEAASQAKADLSLAVAPKTKAKPAKKTVAKKTGAKASKKTK